MSREVSWNLRVWQCSFSQSHGQTHVSHFSTGQLPHNPCYHQANRLCCNISTGQWQRDHLSLNWTLHPTEPAPRFKHVNVTEAFFSLTIWNGYKIFSVPDPLLSRGHNSKPASLQASKLCHQACTLYFYYVCQTIPSSWHVLPQDCYWLFHKLDTVLPWSYWHCPANFVLSLHKTTSPSKASRDHLQYERTLTLKDYTQETPVPLP